jgi:hypothetical protein
MERRKSYSEGLDGSLWIKEVSREKIKKEFLRELSIEIDRIPEFSWLFETDEELFDVICNKCDRLYRETWDEHYFESLEDMDSDLIKKHKLRSNRIKIKLLVIVAMCYIIYMNQCTINRRQGP